MMPSGAFANVLDGIDSVLLRNGLDGRARVVVPQTPAAADIVVVGGADLWQRGEDGRAPIDEIADRPEIAKVEIRRKQRKAELWLQPWWIEALGTALERGDREALHLGDLAADRRFLVDFCDPNATKAFHVGHLRNLAIGHSLASLARAAGADVTSQSMVGDIGRSMGETLAGYLADREGESPATRDIKSDHFVGSCYAGYVESMEPVEGLATDPALSREDDDHDDLAEELLGRWRAADPATVDLWLKLRTWALDGHAQTLERLGIRFDRILLESDFAAEIRNLVERTVAAGVAERAPNGAIGYRTGHDAYPYLLLQRSDGQSTQHLRYLALWHAIVPLLADAHSFQVMGSEWLPLAMHTEEILKRLDPDERIHPATCVVHGMVTASGGVVKSSVGGGWLIDELLDELAGDEGVASLCSRHGCVDADRVAAMVALGYCLSHPASQPMTIERGQLLDAKSNPGWVLAQAWVEAWDPAHDGRPDPRPEDPEYRFLTVQAQLHRRFVARALERLDVLPLVQFHTHLSQRFLESDRTPSRARAMRSVLGHGLSALGLEDGLAGKGLDDGNRAAVMPRAA